MNEGGSRCGEPRSAGWYRWQTAACAVLSILHVLTPFIIPILPAI